MFRILSTCKGGGYQYCRTDPPHPKANAKGLYPLHRVRLENKLGRLLRPDEDAHHKDGDRTNDNPNNLEAKPHADHARHHNKPLDNIKCVCPVCSAAFELKPHYFRLRLKRNGGKLLRCSRSCGGKKLPIYCRSEV